MNAPQVIWVALMAAALAITFARHGAPRKVDAGGATVAVGVHTALLYWGGFFS